MDNIRETIEILFKKIDPEDIIQQTLKNPELELLEKELFSSVFSYKNPYLYSKNEIENLINIIELKWKKLDNVENDNIFNILYHFTGEVLKEKKGKPICKFEELLRWRDLSYNVGEDLLTTSFLAYNDFKNEIERKNFSWETIIKVEAPILSAILKRGLAENHFHLLGSSPHFDLAWITLMNDISKIDIFYENIKETMRLTPEVIHSFNKESIKLKTLLKKAAYIRKEIYSTLEEMDSDTENDIILSSKNEVENYKLFSLHIDDMYKEIKSLRDNFGKKYGDYHLDYAIPEELEDENYIYNSKGYIGNTIFYGERKILYRMFKKIYSGSEDVKKEANLFYAYLLIKEQFRDEVAQVNDRIGFKFFLEYQDRKSQVLGEEYKELMTYLSVNLSKEENKLSSQEIRIASSQGKEGALNNLDEIINSEKYLTKESEEYLDKKVKKITDERETLHSYFYVLHFSKSPEKLYTKKDLEAEINVELRNSQVRKNSRSQAKKIAKLKENNPKEGMRILGVDAANTEIGCRPEVFAQVFRYLRNLEYDDTLKEMLGEEEANLGMTFHVGEEFLDLVDGLRAIDEIIRFLDYKEGDRLGHALALGIDIKKYYRSKNYKLIKPKQVHLDDIVWLLAKEKEYNLNVDKEFKKDLIEEYLKLYDEVYGEELISVDYESYYKAWKLRGDTPNLYSTGKFEKKEISSPLESYAYSKSNELINIRIENDNIYSRLYNLYHYSLKVRVKGAESDIYRVNGEYIKLVESIQNRMLEEIKEKGICIETNPTSNYVIGNFKRYADHPIINFNNRELKIGERKILVSINTDDQGIFPTSLENEYALIAMALLKEKKDNGEKKYTEFQVYKWLDQVRRMGLEQVFKK